MEFLHRYMGFALVALLSVADAAALAAPATRQQLSAEQLFNASTLVNPLPMAAFAMPDNAALPKHVFQGRLIFAGGQRAGAMRIIRDDYQFAEHNAYRVNQMPALDIELVQSASYLIPVQRGALDSAHPHWRYIIGPGRVWQEPGDGDYSRAALPFSLQQKNANCTHNGVMSFMFNSAGSLSNIAYQIASETCLYFKFDLWGLVEAKSAVSTPANAGRIASDFSDEITRRLPVKLIGQLAVDYPAAAIDLLGGAGKIDPGDITLFGFVIDGIHYTGGCQTRYGIYPYCDVMALPSYSLAKTVFAGLGLMHLEKRYPGAKNRVIADYVPECQAAGNWRDVSFENTLDMATGNYYSAQYHRDEESKAFNDYFFSVTTHAKKITYACSGMPRKSKPGRRWVYHTTDTYILGTAINRFIKRHSGDSSDSFNELFVTLWRPLHLSPVTEFTLRSADNEAQPFTGYGLTLYRDDIARMALAINNDSSYLHTMVDKSMLDAAMQRSAADRGLAAADSGLRYNNGVWAYNAKTLLGCKEDLWLPFMSGFGGINVVMMPNNTVYYYFSDGGIFSWADAAKVSNSIRRYCH